MSDLNKEENNQTSGPTPQNDLGPEVISSQLEIKCEQCAGALKFTPGQNALTCQYCGAENKIETSSDIVIPEELDLEKYLEDFDRVNPHITQRAVKCDGCGATTTLADHQVAGDCAFCGTTLVAEQSFEIDTLKPSWILPFRVKKNRSKVLFGEWVKSRWFAPNKFLRMSKDPSRAIKGIYLPFWTYDSNTYTVYTGQRGVNYRVRAGTRNGKPHYETRTRWTFVSGSVSCVFDDVLVAGSASLPRSKQRDLEPWDLGSLQEYRDEFIAGFACETYQIGLKEGYAEAKGIMDNHIASRIRRDIGGDKQRISSMKTTYSDATFKLILLPVWVTSYRFKEKVYRVLINARTGEVQGERPYSWIKISLAVIAGLIVAYFAIMAYLNNSQYAY